MNGIGIPNKNTAHIFVEILVGIFIIGQKVPFFCAIYSPMKK